MLIFQKSFRVDFVPFLPFTFLLYPWFGLHRQVLFYSFLLINPFVTYQLLVVSISKLLDNGTEHGGPAPSQGKIVAVQAAGGIIAGATASCITTPLDTIKTRLQVFPLVSFMNSVACIFLQNGYCFFQNFLYCLPLIDLCAHLGCFSFSLLCFTWVTVSLHSCFMKGYVARTLQNCRWVRIGSKSRWFLEDPTWVWQRFGESEQHIAYNYTMNFGVCSPLGGLGVLFCFLHADWLHRIVH